MRKISRKYRMALMMIVILVMMALCYNDDAPVMLLLMAMATLVACVWIVSEARVDKAAAPLNIATESEHPPDGAQE